MNLILLKHVVFKNITSTIASIFASVFDVYELKKKFVSQSYLKPTNKLKYNF